MKENRMADTYDGDGLSAVGRSLVLEINFIRFCQEFCSLKTLCGFLEEREKRKSWNKITRMVNKSRRTAMSRKMRIRRRRGRRRKRLKQVLMVEGEEEKEVAVLVREEDVKREKEEGSWRQMRWFGR